LIPGSYGRDVRGLCFLSPSLLPPIKKSLKIPKGQSESVYRRRTDNTMAKRKGTKGQENINLGHLFHSFQGSILTYMTGATSGAGNAYPFGVHHKF
jgi:hypothetical protein